MRHSSTAGLSRCSSPSTPIFPSTRRAPTRAVAQFRRSITAPWIPLWRWRPRQLPQSLVLGTGIALIPERDPIVTAKEVASLDLVSQGRFRFGVGVGWLREEVANHGVDSAVRGRVIDERLRAIIEIWTQEQAEFHGTYVDFDPIYCWPKPVTKPYPPLYVGGDRRTSADSPAQCRVDRDQSITAAAVGSASAVARHGRGDVPVTVCQWGEAAAKDLEGYRHLGVERVLLELPTEPRDPTLRYLDKLQAELARLA